MTTTRIVLALALLSVGACSKKDADNTAAAKTSDPAPTAPAAAEPVAAPVAAPAPATGTAWLALAPLAVQLEAPAGSTAKDQSEGTLKQVGVEAGTAMLSVGVVPADMKQTFDAFVTAGNAGGSKVTTKDKLADGFHVEATSESGMIQIDIRRTIGGTEYSCGTLAPDADTAKIVRAACLSLKAK